MATNNTEKELKSSVSSIYADLLSKRAVKKAAKEEQKRMDKELEEQKKEEKETKEDGTKMTKKEKRQAELDNWKEVVIGLTGDDIEYTNEKKNKKKYRKWIDDDDFNSVITAKQKKPKKKNYNKEFEPELNMLRTLVAEQNRFTADLQKRFQNAAGPATKDAQYPNKTLVELASAIGTGRSNSLGMIREIGNLKKTIADLYMKQKKLDADMGTSAVDTTDLGLMGSSIASSLFTSSPAPQPAAFDVPANDFTQPMGYAPQQPGPQQPAPVVTAQVESFDPASWEGPDTSDSYSKYEAIPHTTVVEKNQATGDMRFVAIRDDNGQELVGCPVPTSDPRYLKINEEEMTVKGDFDEVYKLKYV